MKKLFKIIIGIMIATLLLVSIAVAALAFFVDPNSIKPYLTKVVSDKTGQELSIDGKLKWRIYPQLGISAENILLKNKPNFPEEPMLSANKLVVSVQVLPLLSKQVKINKIMIHDANVNLTINKNDEANWAFKQPKKTSPKPTENEKKSKSFSVDVSKISIQNAKIKYNNMLQNKITTISSFNLNTKEIEPNKPFKVDSSFTFGKTNYNFSGMVQYHPLEALLLLHDYHFSFEGEKTATLSGNAEINIAKERLEMKPLTFKMADLEANGSLQGQNIFSNLDIRGNAQTNNFNPKSVFSAFGKPIRTNTSDALSSAKLTTDIIINSQAIQLKNLSASIDKSKFNGDARYLPNKSTVVFNLVGDQIAIDRYTLVKNVAKNGFKKKSSENKNNDSSTKTLNLDGRISLNTIYAKNARIDNFKSNLSYSDNELRFTNLSAGVFEGTTSGSVTINMKPKTPIVQLNQTLNNISVAAAQNTIVGTAKITGQANARINISLQDGLNTLNGDINIISRNGEIDGVDVDYQIARAANFIQKITTGTPENRGKTPYSVITAQLNIKNGVAYNPHMIIESPTMKVRAKGKTNLVNKELDYKFAARTKKPTEINTENIHMDLADYDIPIIVKGTIDNPKVSLDLAELAKITAKKQIIKTIEKHIIPGDGKPISDTIEKIKDVLPF